MLTARRGKAFSASVPGWWVQRQPGMAVDVRVRVGVVMAGLARSLTCPGPCFRVVPVVTGCRIDRAVSGGHAGRWMSVSRAERAAITLVVQRLSAQFSLLVPAVVEGVVRDTYRRFDGHTRPVSSCRSWSRTRPATGSGLPRWSDEPEPGRRPRRRRWSHPQPRRHQGSDTPVSVSACHGPVPGRRSAGRAHADAPAASSRGAAVGCGTIL